MKHFLDITMDTMIDHVSRTVVYWRLRVISRACEFHVQYANMRMCLKHAKCKHIILAKNFRSETPRRIHNHNIMFVHQHSHKQCISQTLITSIHTSSSIVHLSKGVHVCAIKDMKSSKIM